MKALFLLIFSSLIATLVSHAQEAEQGDSQKSHQSSVYVSKLSTIDEMKSVVLTSVQMLIDGGADGDVDYLRYLSNYWPAVPSQNDEFVSFSRSFRGILRRFNMNSGRPTGYELARVRSYRDRMVFFDVLLYHERGATFWRYAFYQTSDRAWDILQIDYHHDFTVILDEAQELNIHQQ